MNQLFVEPQEGIFWFEKIFQFGKISKSRKKTAKSLEAKEEILNRPKPLAFSTFHLHLRKIKLKLSTRFKAINPKEMA